MSSRILLKRGTAAQVTAAASGGLLLTGEAFLVTDQGRMGIATGTTTYEVFLKSSEVAPIAHVGSGGTAHAAATTSTAGFMSFSDKTKLDGIAAGAEVNVNADWSAVSGDAQILNKPTLGTAAAAATTDFVAAAHAGAGGSAHALATTSVAGFMSGADKTKLDGLSATSIFHVDSYGAVGGSADDAGAFQAALNAASAAGANVVYYSRNHRILSNVTIPKYCSLIGPLAMPGQQQDGGSGGDYDTGNGVLKVSSTKTITLMHGSSLKKGILIRDGLDLPFTSVATAQAGIAAFAGTAVTINGDDATCEDLLILGFNLAIRSTNRGRMRFTNVQGDCTNGIEISTCLDVTYLTNCHFWPFTTANYSWTASDTTQGILTRSGIAYHLHDTVDWPKLTNCFSYGYARGFRFHDCGAFYVSGCAADGPVNAGVPVQSGSIGVLVEGLVQDGAIAGAYMAGKDQGYYFNTTGVSYTMLTDSQAIACNLAFYFPGTGGVDITGGLARACTHGLYVSSSTFRVDVDGLRLRQITGYEFVATVSITQMFCRNMDYLTKSGGASAVNSATNFNLPHIVSAATLVIPNDYGDSYIVDNSVTITSILGGYTGRVIRLIFQSGLTVQNGGNIRLSGGVNFVGAANSSLTFMWDQTRWVEMGRCV